MSEVDMVNERDMYNLLCRIFDKKGWRHKRVEEALMIESRLNGDDIPVDFTISVIPSCEVISFMSWLPFQVSEAKRMDIAMAVCTVNNSLIAGSFDYNVERGELAFRFTTCYKGSNLSEVLLEEMIMISAMFVDKYNDKFFMISNNMMSLQDLDRFIKNS